MNKYLRQFMGLNCAPDVLSATGPISSGNKEITEAFAAVTKLRSFVLAKPMHYSVFDLCAGNCLMGILAVHLLPVRDVTAVDLRDGKGSFYRARNFEYWQRDIRTLTPEDIVCPSILVAVHACTDKAWAVVDLYNKSPNAHALILMPCCIKTPFRQKIPQPVVDKMGKYETFALDLAMAAKGTYVIDHSVLSPKRAIVIAHKGEVID